MFHHQEVCTSSLQYIIMHLYEESSCWHSTIDAWWWTIICSKHIEDKLSETN